MKSFLIVSIFASALLAVEGTASNCTAHTPCYNYFLQKDNCVVGSLDHPCPPRPCQGTATTIRSFQAPNTIQAGNNRLARRYDTTIPTQAVGGGDGICGTYDTNSTLGVCLWSGSNWVSGSDPSTAGWLNGAETRNCNKQVFVQRQGQPDTVQFAPVLDGCSFLTKDPAVGCFQLWMTIDLFMKFNPTPEEVSNWTINSTFSWDFDNPGDKPQFAPV